MYMPGRLRTASRPSSTVMEEAPYSGTEVPTAAWAAGSCLVVPFKGFVSSFLTRTHHAHKRRSGLQATDLTEEFGCQRDGGRGRFSASSIACGTALRTAQNSSQIGENGGVREEHRGQLTASSVGQSELPPRPPPAQPAPPPAPRPQHTARSRSHH